MQNTTDYRTTLTAATIRALLTLALPNTRLLICDSECYLIRKAPKRVSGKAYEALLAAGWISHPQAVGAGIAECLMTSEGRAEAKKIREEISGYCQLLLFDEDAATEESTTDGQPDLVDRYVQLTWQQ